MIATALAVAALLLGLRGGHVDVQHGDLEQLRDGRGDLQLVGVVMHREGVLVTLRLVHRLLADDRAQDDLRSLERHAYTSAIVPMDGWVMTSVSAFRMSTTLSESARMTIDARQVARRQLQPLVLAGLDHEHPALRLERSEVAHELAGLDGVEVQVGHELDGAVGELGGQCALERQSTHPLGQLLDVRPGMRAEDDATATIVRCGHGALAGAAGALLAVRLLAAATDLAAGLGVSGAGAASGQLGDDRLVQHRGVHGCREQRIGQLDRAGLGAGLGVQRGGDGHG